MLEAAACASGVQLGDLSENCLLSTDLNTAKGINQEFTVYTANSPPKPAWVVRVTILVSGPAEMGSERRIAPSAQAELWGCCPTWILLWVSLLCFITVPSRAMRGIDSPGITVTVGYGCVLVRQRIFCAFKTYLCS